jgi:EpsI family protein
VEGSLADRLYNKIVERTYQNQETGAEIMMLLAHGQRNTDDLQLHRPESCYPAFGFKLTRNAPTLVDLAPKVQLPARRLVAEAPGRLESIIYWARMGEFLPIDSREQRRDRLRTAMDGYIADGVLARFSSVSEHPDATLDMIQAFVPALIRATPARARDALIGTARAKALQAI